MANSIRIKNGDIQSTTPAEFIYGRSVASDVPATLHLDLSTAMVYVTNLLRFCGRNGDFYIFDERTDNFSVTAYNLRVKFNFLSDTAYRTDLLLHDVALSIAGITDGYISNELARID